MDNIVMKVCKILIIICIICIFIISPLLDAYACNDEDVICMFVSYMNSDKFYNKYITVYEGIYTIDDIDMYVFTDVYIDNNIFINYITYAVYIDACNIIYYDEIDICNYDNIIGLKDDTGLPYTAIVVRDNPNTVYYKGDVHEN